MRGLYGLLYIKIKNVEILKQNSRSDLPWAKSLLLVFQHFSSLT